MSKITFYFKINSSPPSTGTAFYFSYPTKIMLYAFIGMMVITLGFFIGNSTVGFMTTPLLDSTVGV